MKLGTFLQICMFYACEIVILLVAAAHWKESMKWIGINQHIGGFILVFGGFIILNSYGMMMKNAKEAESMTSKNAEKRQSVK